MVAKAAERAEQKRQRMWSGFQEKLMKAERPGRMGDALFLELANLRELNGLAGKWLARKWWSTVLL